MERTNRPGRSKRRAVAALVGALGVGAVAAPPASAVVGGSPVADGQRTFVVRIEQRGDDGKWSHFCGAALIDRRVVATAAHCAMWAEKGKMTIRLVVGRADTNTPGGTVIEDGFTVYSHPKFSTVTNTDLGLIVLNRPVAGQVAELPALGEKLKPGRVLRAAGWGRTDLEDPAKPSRLREARLPVTAFDTEGGIWDKEFICAGTPTARIGPGDSGGPLFSTGVKGKPVVHGLVTGDTNTCQGLFTNLADPAVWEPFRKPLAEHGLSHVIKK
ncbi:S1 family peptidase [Streptomyces sp. NPDC050504]|uniref:S1 family peptidase n=1 Tax=Streptomyces sp. NPDC050504 TaxID=3365618 RepID=UPI0037979F8D